MENKSIKTLIRTGISTLDSIEPFYPRVRDREDISVLKCNKSDVILLSRTDHIDVRYYENKDTLNSKNRQFIIDNSLEDTNRRYNKFKNIISNKIWLDIGTGAGCILDKLSKYALETHAVEPQKDLRNKLLDLGYNIYSSIDKVPNNYFEVISMFHVFEHFIDPIETLMIIKDKMIAGGTIIIEVPHARDFLISFLNNNDLKSFTFWSEHMILHTRESISLILKYVGFSDILVIPCQRYSLSNHLYWLAKGKPGGHLIWEHLRNKNLEIEYEKMLTNIDNTDTLILIANKI